MSYSLKLSISRKQELVARFKKEIEEHNTENISSFLDDIFYKSPIDDNNFLQTIKTFFCGGENLQLLQLQLKKYNYSTICGLVWNTNYVAYRCRTCAISPCMSICPGCFKGANHENEGHDYNLFRSQAGGACDCGDSNVMKIEGFCGRHSLCIQNKPKPPKENFLLPEVMAPYLVTKLISFFREYCGPNGELDLINQLPLCYTYIDLLTLFFNLSMHMKELLAIALIDPKIYDDFVKDVHNKGGKGDIGPPVSAPAEDSPILAEGVGLPAVVAAAPNSPYRHSLAQHHERYVLACNKLGTDPRGLQMCQLIECHDRNTVRFFQHTSVVDELMMWCFAAELPQELVTFFLSFLTHNDYKVAFCEAFVKHYACLPRVLMRSQDPDTVSYRLVHISVQLFSNERLALKMVQGDSKLLHLIINSLNLLILPILIPQVKGGAGGHGSHVTVDCSNKIMQSHCYWPIVSDFITLLSHQSVALYFLRENNLLILWTHILYCFQGMNDNKRETAEHLEFEPRTYYVAFSSELETCSSTLSALLSQLFRVPETGNEGEPERGVSKVIFKDFKGLLNNVLLSIQDWFEKMDDGTENPPRDRVSFHLPLHRYLALIISTGMRHFGMTSYDVIDVLADTHPSISLQTYLRNMVKHPLRIQVAIHEIACGMWVRNGMQIKGQVLTYLQSNFNHCMAYPDIFLFQLCACLIPAEEFMDILFDGFGVSWNEGMWKKGPTDQEYRLIEGSLQLLATIVTFRNLIGNDEYETLRSEMVVALCKGKPTHSQLLDLVPDKSAYSNANRQSANFGNILEEIADFKPPDFETGGEISQGYYVPKGLVWEQLYNPLQLLYTDMTRKDYQTSMDRYKEYWKWNPSRSIPGSVADMWAPFRIPAPLDLQDASTRLFGMLPNLLHTDSLFRILDNIFYDYLRNASHFPETLLQMAVYVLRLSLKLPPITPQAFHQLNQEKLVLKMGISSDYSKAKRKGSLLDPECEDLPPRLSELNDPHSSRLISAVCDARVLAFKNYCHDYDLTVSSSIDGRHQALLDKWLEMSAVNQNPDFPSSSNSGSVSATTRFSLFTKFAAMTPTSATTSSSTSHNPHGASSDRNLSVVECLERIRAQHLALDPNRSSIHYISSVLEDLCPVGVRAQGPLPDTEPEGSSPVGMSPSKTLGTDGGRSISVKKETGRGGIIEPFRTNEKKRLARERQKKIMEAYAAKQKKFMEHVAKDRSMEEESAKIFDTSNDGSQASGSFNNYTTAGFQYVSPEAGFLPEADGWPELLSSQQHKKKPDPGAKAARIAATKSGRNSGHVGDILSCAICGISQSTVGCPDDQPMGLVTLINGSNINGKRWNAYIRVPKLWQPDTMVIPVPLYDDDGSSAKLTIDGEAVVDQTAAPSHHHPPDVLDVEETVFEQNHLPHLITNDMVRSLRCFARSFSNSISPMTEELPISLSELTTFRRLMCNILMSLGITNQKWYYATQNYGWDKYPHVTTCGHYLHVSCHRSYLQTLQAHNNTFNSAIVSNLGEYQCPVCRHLANALTPLTLPTTVVGEDDCEADDIVICAAPDLQTEFYKLTQTAPLDNDYGINLGRYLEMAPTPEDRCQSMFVDKLTEYFLPPAPALTIVLGIEDDDNTMANLPPAYPIFHDFAELSSALRMNVMAEITSHKISTSDPGTRPFVPQLNPPPMEVQQPSSDLHSHPAASFHSPFQRIQVPDSKSPQISSVDRSVGFQRESETSLHVILSSHKKHFIYSLAKSLSSRLLRLGYDAIPQIIHSMIKLFQSISDRPYSSKRDEELHEIASTNLSDPHAILTHFVLILLIERRTISPRLYTALLRVIFRFYLYQISHALYICLKNSREYKSNPEPLMQLIYQLSVGGDCRPRNKFLENTLFTRLICSSISFYHWAYRIHPTVPVDKSDVKGGPVEEASPYHLAYVVRSLLNEVLNQIFPFIEYCSVLKGIFVTGAFNSSDIIDTSTGTTLCSESRHDPESTLGPDMGSGKPAMSQDLLTVLRQLINNGPLSCPSRFRFNHLLRVCEIFRDADDSSDKILMVRFFDPNADNVAAELAIRLMSHASETGDQPSVSKGATSKSDEEPMDIEPVATEPQEVVKVNKTVGEVPLSFPKLDATYRDETSSNKDLASALSSSVTLLLVSDRCWIRRPAFMDLPDCYDQLFSLYYSMRCKECGFAPADPALCLRCGTLICLKGRCCSKDTIFEAVGHSIKCGVGTAVYQIINSSLILIIHGYRACVWGSLYLDKFGEEDKDLKRGKPLYLCEPRLKYLENLYATDSFAQHIKRWTWHMNIL